MTESDGNPDCFELTYATRECVAHKFIEATSRGVRFEDSDKFFSRYFDTHVSWCLWLDNSKSMMLIQMVLNIAYV